MITAVGVFSPMKLSQAIREGALLAPQCRGHIMMTIGGIETCALGAAYHRVLDGPMIKVYKGIAISEELCWFKAADAKILAYWRKMFSTSHLCPATGYSMKLASIIVFLNDKHGWTRERIADWVESVEVKLGDAAYPLEVPTL